MSPCPFSKPNVPTLIPDWKAVHTLVTNKASYLKQFKGYSQDCLVTKQLQHSCINSCQGKCSHVNETCCIKMLWELEQRGWKMLIIFCSEQAEETSECKEQIWEQASFLNTWQLKTCKRLKALHVCKKQKLHTCHWGGLVSAATQKDIWKKTEGNYRIFYPSEWCVAKLPLKFTTVGF